ncbi:AMMECR1 domain-containing protein [Limtongia smithiae]|uniref:AMMECR1 domain-containing protein n=1 Tax=Limtongia smithiae TaxID=1125753 RepID=UPI0034CFF69F
MASRAQCALCFDVLVAHFESRSPIALASFVRALDSSPTSAASSSTSLVDTPSPVSGAGSSFAAVASNSATSGNFPLFVTWNTVTKSGQTRLRGCIGTFEAQPLEKGLRTYAAVAAFEDTRFSPISLKELPTLECGVSLLTDFEDATGPLDWEWGVHGIRISFRADGRRYSATYLPDVPPEHFKSKEQTIESLVHKSGYYGARWTTLDMKVVRYQSSKEHMLYKEYAALRENL